MLKVLVVLAWGMTMPATVLLMVLLCLPGFVYKPLGEWIASTRLLRKLEDWTEFLR